MKFSTAIIASMLFSTSAFSQDAVKVCNSLANSGLIDTESRTTIVEQAENEVDLFCNEESRFSSNYSSKSSGFQGAFKRVGISLGFSSAGGAGFSTSEFLKMCSDNRTDLRNFYFQQYDKKAGRALAENVVDCLRVVTTRSEYLYGDVSFNPAGTEILVTVNRKGSLQGGIYNFSSISSLSDFGSCKSGDKPAIGRKLFENMSFSCPVKPVNGSQPPIAAGRIEFCRVDGSCLEALKFSVVRKSFRDQVLEEHIDALKGRFDALEASLDGSVVAFSSPKDDAEAHPQCPNGWSLYKPAQGRFVRGYDRDGQVDPRSDPSDSSKRREIGSVWDDTVLKHSHTANMEVGAEPFHTGAKAQQAAGAHGRIGVMYTSSGLVNEFGDLETAPKSVVLLYCLKGSS